VNNHEKTNARSFSTFRISAFFWSEQRIYTEKLHQNGSLEYIGNITFYLEKKTQTMLAYKNGKIKWKSNVIKVCAKPAVGKSEISDIQIEHNGLKIVYGKHSFAKIVLETGEVICEGSD
jgi:hypothetical protein